MKLKHFYLILMVIGFVVPYYFFISFLMAHGLDPRELVRQLFSTYISTFFAVDLIIASIVFIVYLRREALRCSMENWWVYLVPLFTVGLSLALPLFLYVRESHQTR